jgi:hypothetical protein
MVTGVVGSVFDPNPDAPVNGALCTGIAIGTNNVYGPPPNGANTPTLTGISPSVHTIGLGPKTTRMKSVDFPALTMAFILASADVAPDGIVNNGYINKTGKLIPAGGCCYGVK